MNPFIAPGEWLKAALHVHTTASDGKVSPREALEAYRELGYDVVALTDHDRVTLADPPAGLTLLTGAEWSAAVPDSPAGFHFVTVGIGPVDAAAVMALRDRPIEMAALLRTLCPVVIVAHPYWSALTTELLDALGPDGALEVYNHGCELEDALGYSHYVWDQLLARGRHWLGLAVDDSHWSAPDHGGAWVMPKSSDHGEAPVMAKSPDHGGAWVMVKSPDRSPSSVVAALSSGCFYSSTGPTIESFSLTGRTVTLRCSAAVSILLRCNGSLGTGLHRPAPGESLTFAEHLLPARARFVRAEVTDSAGGKAWTNPIYLA
ncbi:MAG: CehA/McbA family metallohydrolase [Planctomycetota bacterium]|nr:CehA/McbA family metallohydrolase [Planctomycetota bacterium]